MILQELLDLLKRVIKVDPEAANEEVEYVNGKKKHLPINYIGHDTKHKKRKILLEE